MLDTNPESVKVLSDDEVEKIAARKTHQYGSMVSLPVAERDALCQTVRALRQQLEESDRIIKSYNDQEWESNTALREQLAQVTQERERLLRGKFTPQEFQDLCHNTDVQKGFEAFADGCESYQQKIFGRCRKGKTE